MGRKKKKGKRNRRSPVEPITGSEQPGLDRVFVPHLSDFSIEPGSEPQPVFSDLVQTIYSSNLFALLFSEMSPFQEEYPGVSYSKDEEVFKVRPVASIRVQPSNFMYMLIRMALSWNRYSEEFGIEGGVQFRMFNSEGKDVSHILSREGAEEFTKAAKEDKAASPGQE